MRPFESVEAPIFGKAVGLTDAENHRVVLITTDLIGFSAAVVDPICERIIEETGVDGIAKLAGEAGRAIP